MSFSNTLSKLKLDNETYKRMQNANHAARDHPNFPDIVPSKQLSIDLPLNDKSYQIVRKNCQAELLVDLNFKNIIEDQAPVKTANDAFNQYSDEKVTSQILRGITDWLCDIHIFICIENSALYIYQNDYLHLFSYAFAARFLTQICHEYNLNYPLRSADFKEIVRLLQAQPQIMKRQDECRTNQNCILFDDGAFDVPSQTMQRPCIKDYQFSKINFPLHWDTEYTASPEARDFIQRFCSYNAVLEDYLWELIGYLLSSYQKKFLVVFCGPSNSGKSTLANMIRRICGTETCVALGIKELAGSFNLAELQGKRLCIDSDMDSAVLTSRDISLLKKVVGNDLIQGNRKFEQQFYFQCQTKFLICTNNRIKFKSNEDTISFFNRLKFFELQKSIPSEEQCHDMDTILDANRTYFLQRAMEGLCRLVSNNFQFSYEEPAENFVENIGHCADVNCIHDFVNTCCKFDYDATETVGNLYDAYECFVNDNGKKAVSKKKFSCFLADNYDVSRDRTGTIRYFTGIKLMTNDR